MITRTDLNQRFDSEGNLVSQQAVEVDVTEKAVEYDLNDKLRQAIASLQQIQRVDATNLAQVNVALDRLSKVCIGLIRLTIREDLLRENDGA